MTDTVKQACEELDKCGRDLHLMTSSGESVDHIAFKLIEYSQRILDVTNALLTEFDRNYRLCQTVLMQIHVNLEFFNKKMTERDNENTDATGDI